VVDVPFFPHLVGSRMRECDRVAAASLAFLGRGYRITRELVPDLMDCSTVVSQAHWDGAGIQTPFIAETQRLATNAVDVAWADLLPGDSIFIYPSRAQAPGGRHNHVVLYLGPDDRGTPWTIESSTTRGVVLTELATVSPGGGIRRFCQRPRQVFADDTWSGLAARVPKLARLGSRLIARYGPVGRHQGIDVYVAQDTTVVSPVDATVHRVAGEHACSVFVELWAPARRVLTRIGPVTPAPGLRAGADVVRGAPLGVPAPRAVPGPCNVTNIAAGRRRLHWELWARPEFGVSPATDTARTHDGRRLIAHNAVYAVKLGLVGSCLGG
jgi:hypothetical protein